MFDFFTALFALAGAVLLSLILHGPSLWQARRTRVSSEPRFA